MPASTAPEAILQDMDGCAVDVAKVVVHPQKISLWDRAWLWLLNGMARGLNSENARV